MTTQRTEESGADAGRLTSREAWWLRASDWWFRTVVRLYPPDFRDSMGPAVVDAYRDQSRAQVARHGAWVLPVIWLRALKDSAWNAPNERVRPAVRWRRSGNWGRDMELTVRRLTRAPTFALAIITTLMIGLGAFAVVATVVYKVLLAPLPYENPDDLYFVWRDYGTLADMKRGNLAGTDVAELLKSDAVIEDATALVNSRTTMVAPDAEPMEINVLATSPNLFTLLGSTPLLGRTFAPTEVGPGRPAVVVLTYSLWRQLGGAPSIIGTDIRLGDTPYQVIGVMPESFGFVRNSSIGPPLRGDAYTPLDVHLADTNPSDGSYAGLIRVRHSTTAAQVDAAVHAVGQIVDRRDFAGNGVKLYAVPLHDDLVAGVRPALLSVGAAGVFLLLVLMVNLATLLLSRATAREKEFAVSRALGANRLAIVRATLLEGGLLGFVGGVAAAIAAVWGTQAIVRLTPADLPHREFIAMDWKLALFITVIGVTLGLLAATLPAWWTVRTKLSTLLSATAVRGGGGHGRMRRGMVVLQVALSLMLLSAGGLIVRSFDRLLRTDAGFNAEGLLVVRVPLPEENGGDVPAAAAAHQRIEDALRALPGVTHVSATSALPLSANTGQRMFTIAGAPGNTGDADHDAPLIDFVGVRAGYFEAMGIPLVAGRDFDRFMRPGVSEAVIDQSMANHFYPNASPIGARIPFFDDTVTVVGVVAHARLYDVHEDGRPQLFVRAEQYGFGGMTWTLRTGREPMELLPEVRSAIRAVDPGLALAEPRPMTADVSESISQQRVSAVLIGGFALGGLLLAAMGLFGIVSTATMRRRHELAVRLALGADYGRVLRLVLMEGASLVAIGVAIGIPGAFLAGRAISGALIGISPTDPVTLVVVAAAMITITLIACYIPARRALQIEPAISLRNESA